jgi:hypothetical protein
MKKIFFLLAIILAVQSLPAQLTDNSLFQPLFLSTNGPGRIFPAYHGEMLRVGRRYTIEAVPDRGYKFASWQPVTVFIITQTNYDSGGEPILPPDQSIISSVVPTNIYRPDLEFRMQGVIWITSNGNNPNIARAFGWQANFVPWYEPVPRPPR